MRTRSKLTLNAIYLSHLWLNVILTMRVSPGTTANHQLNLKQEMHFLAFSTGHHVTPKETSDKKMTIKKTIMDQKKKGQDIIYLQTFRHQPPPSCFGRIVYRHLSLNQSSFVHFCTSLWANNSALWIIWDHFSACWSEMIYSAFNASLKEQTHGIHLPAVS